MLKAIVVMSVYNKEVLYKGAKRPQYNSERYLKAAIESVLQQSFRDFKFIIVNDASRDRSKNILDKFASENSRIKLINNRRRMGLTKSLNLAIKSTLSQYVIRMDADDISLPRRFAEQIQFMDRQPEVGVSGTWVYLIDKNDKKLKVKKMPTKAKDIKKTAIKANPFIHPSLIIRHSIFKEIGYYNEKFLYAQDYEFILRILKKYQGVNLPRPLILYRIGGEKSASVRFIKQQEKFAMSARIKALKELGYPWWQAIYLFKPAISYLIPAGLKLLFYKKFFWRS